MGLMRKEPISPNQYYHIYNRGVAKGNIFFKPSHWSFFLRRLTDYFQPDLADILAYCLMPNHFHLLIFIKCEDFSHQVMHPFTISFTRAVNRDMGRVGPLFQGPYQAKLVTESEQLVHLTKYIHHNPVEAKLASTPEEWVYSSYQDYIGFRNGSLPRIDFELLGFKSQKEYREYVNLPLDKEKIQRLLFKEA
jgi:REP element-mobilizing transposase RayT